MRVVCNVTNCKNWSENGGDYAGEGGCTFDEIRITDEITIAGFVPVCEGFEKRNDTKNDRTGIYG